MVSRLTRPSGRAFLGAFALSSVLLIAPLIGLAARLVALGEIDIGVGADRAATLKGTLFADTPVQKLREVRERRPAVLVLGSSRVGMIRGDMFSRCADRPGCFFNATGAMPSMRTGLDLLRALAREESPRVLVLGIDVWNFDPNHAPAVGDRGRLQRDLRGQLDHALAVTRDAAWVVASDPDVRRVVLGQVPIPGTASGLAAIVHQTGYRSDGSIEQPDETWRRAMALSEATRSADYLRLIRIGGFEFEPFERVDDDALTDLVSLLDLAAAREIQVVAFTPPFGDAVAAAMRAQPHYAEGVSSVYSTLAATFAARRIPFVGGLSMSEHGCAPDQHYDGLHVSEVCAARILLALGRNAPEDPFLGYLDGAILAARLASAPSSFRLPPP